MGVPQVDKHNLRPSRSTESLDSRVAAAERKERDIRKQLNDAKGEVLQLRAVSRQPVILIIYVLYFYSSTNPAFIHTFTSYEGYLKNRSSACNEVFIGGLNL